MLTLRIRRAKRVRRSVLALTALALVVAPLTLAAPATAETATGAPAKGEPILIGNVGTYRQQGFTGVPAGKLALEAWGKWVNAHGGINGHPVKLVIRNNGGDQAQAVSLVKELVEEEHVVAFVAQQDGSLNAGYTDYLKEKNIPVLGGSVFTLEPWVTHPMFFPQGLTALPTINSIIDAVKVKGYDRIGSLACAEAAQCSAANTLIESLAKANGMTYAYGGTVSSTAPDYTATCLAAKEKKTQAIVLLIADADQGIKIADDCARQDFTPSWVLPGEAISDGYLEPDSFDKALNNAPVIPWFVKDASTKDFHAALKKYAPDLDLSDVDLPLNAVDAWVAGLMFQKAVELSGATGIPTSADLLAGLGKFQDETLGGMALGLTFTDPSDKTQRCYITIEIKKHKFTLPNGTDPECVAGA